jgi:phage protein D
MRRREAPMFLVKVGAPNAPTVRLDLSARILSIEYEDHESKADQLVLTVDNFHLNHIESPIWRKGNIVEVSWGYAGSMSPPRECVVIKVTGSKQVKVTCLDKGILFHRRHKIRTFDGVRRSDVARKIAEEYDFDRDRQFIQDTKVVLPHVTQARQTDAQLLANMAKREGFHWFIDFDGFHLHERQLGQKPIRTFIYYTDPGEGDIIDFRMDQAISMSKPGSVRVEYVDPTTRERGQYTASNTNTPRTSLAPVIDVVNEEDLSDHDEPMTKTTSTAHVLTSYEGADAAKRLADGMYKKAQLAAVQIELECWGDERMVAKSIVSVQRIGPTISGNYYVRSVKHKIQPTNDGYTMTLELRRDGRNRATATAFDQLPGQGTGAKSTAHVNGQPAQDPNTVTAVEEVDEVNLVSRVRYVDTGGRQIPRNP